MEEDDFEDPLGMQNVNKSTRNVDIITKCAIPKTMINSANQNKNLKLAKKRSANHHRVKRNNRARSIDDFSTIEEQLATLFKGETDIPQSPISKLLPVENRQENPSSITSKYPKVDFETLLDPNEQLKPYDVESILLALNAQTLKERGDLDDFLNELQAHIGAIDEIEEKLVQHKLYDLRFIRMNGIRAAVYETLAIKRCNRILDIITYNLQLIDEFRAFLKKRSKGAKVFPGILLDVFLSDCIKQYEMSKIDKKIEGLCLKIKPIKGAKGDSVSQFLSPDKRSGRIVARFISRVKEMRYSDLDVILTAITPNEKLFGTIRSIMFDLAWQQIPFPFAPVSHLTFPRIFDLTPRSINPPYLPEEYLDMPFNKLNGTNWPYKFTEDYFFTIMCYRNPFSMANRFCAMIQEVANVLQDLAVTVGGEKESDVEIGFDNLFANLLVCVFAFGCPGLLDSLEYCSLFLDYTNDAHQQFAMTHCAGIVEHVRGTSTEDFRRRVKLHKMIPFFSFSMLS
ncbi:hypothetical protein TRFO_07788 [Tritrichomonas foetus]|uniref:Uncharacterized protein n=1 Tax=Tritrichomonas foetus TaxID=1144522 RepID=A0A1J4JPW8_9EUKA|nr:hypothetical protein TRFO_07788 [Tritrichomonas foetus]|eukprot:OHT00802.1 hypothetical protein TRFO_07788 [Tritrichomonas foetus]